LDRLSLGEGPQLLAPVASQLLQPSPSWPSSLEMGQVQAHWCSSLPVAHLVSQLPGPMAPSPVILASVPQEPLLQTASLVLGPMEAHWTSPLPLARFEAVDWISLAQGASLLASVATQSL
jgi:hypothetical protein